MNSLRALITILVVVLATGAGHGAVQARGHQFTTFDVPKGGTGPGQGTTAYSINPQGDIVGSYVDRKASAMGSCSTRGGTPRSTIPKRAVPCWPASTRGATSWATTA